MGPFALEPAWQKRSGPSGRGNAIIKRMPL